MKKRKGCVIGAAGSGTNGLEEYLIIQELKAFGWTVLVNWKSEAEDKLRFDVVDDSYDRKFIKDVDLKSFLTSIKRDKKLNDLGL